MGASVNTSNFVLDLLKYLGKEVWEIARYDIQSIENLEFSKRKLENRNLKDPIPSFARNYVYSVGYVDTFWYLLSKRPINKYCEIREPNLESWYSMWGLKLIFYFFESSMSLNFILILKSLHLPKIVSFSFILFWFNLDSSFLPLYM